MTAEQLAAVTAIEESCDRIGKRQGASRAGADVNATPSQARSQRASAQSSPLTNYVRALPSFPRLIGSSAFAARLALGIRSRRDGTSPTTSADGLQISLGFNVESHE